MKILVSLSIILMMLSSCGQKNQYSIEVTANGGPDSLIVHNNWYTSSDTLVLRDGKCTFSGTIDTFPKLVSLGFPFPAQVNTRMILEPGRIDVTYNKEEGFRIGGTKNNVILQKLFDELKPSQAEVTKTWREWSQAYNKIPRIKEECEAVWVVQEEAKKFNLEKTRELIKANPNYAGLVISLPIIRSEPAEYLKEYVESFKAFSNDERYQSIVKEYEIAEKTISG
jgi:hypothetical protein